MVTFKILLQSVTLLVLLLQYNLKLKAISLILTKANMKTEYKYEDLHVKNIYTCNLQLINQKVKQIVHIKHYIPIKTYVKYSILAL